MADLAQIQSKLNSSAAEKQKFLQDPVAYLSQQGVTLPAAAQQKLVQQLQGAANPNPNSGWSVGVTVGT